MSNVRFDSVANCSQEPMKYGHSAEEFAALTQKNNMDDTEIRAVAKVFEYLKEKKEHATIDFLLRTSRLPLKAPETFDNFDFGRIVGKNVDKLRSLSTFSALYAHKKPCLYWKDGDGENPLGARIWLNLLRSGRRASRVVVLRLFPCGRMQRSRLFLQTRRTTTKSII